jgi:hypothetical protein
MTVMRNVTCAVTCTVVHGVTENCCSDSGDGPTDGSGLMLEDSSGFLLLETGDFLLLE